MRKLLVSLGGVALFGVHLALGPVLHRWRTQGGATDAEIRRRLPGDEFVPDTHWSYTSAITIDAPRASVWLWLLQVGQRRGGFYSYQRLENLVGCDIHYVLEIRPDLQRLRRRDTIRMHRSGFGPTMTLPEPERSLVMGGVPAPDGSRITWSLHLLEGSDGTTG
jgi:hypothetical protein